MSSEHVESRPAASDTSAFAPEHGLTIQDASAWILRVGVVTSVLIMLIGLAISFLHRPVSVAQMQRATFNGHASQIWDGVRALSGESIIDVGIYLLVLTPILRVVTSMVLFFFEEHDRLYTVVTFFVLLLTLTGLLFLK